MQFIEVGHGNYIAASKVTGVVRVDAAPIRRMIAAARKDNQVVDCTMGEKTHAVIVTADNQLILSAKSPETLAEGVTDI